MKLALSLLVSAATIDSISVLSPAYQPESDSPDSRFRVELTFYSPFLPVNDTLMNVIHFMSAVAQHGFEEHLEPCTYSAPMYRQVQITTYEWTEARFLLWGIYLAATDMVKYSRFLNVMVKLYWENNPVSQITLMVNPYLALPSTTRNETRSNIDDGGGLSLAGTSNNTTDNFVERLNILPIKNITHHGTADNVSVVSSNKTWITAFGMRTTSHTPFLTNALFLPRLTIDFDRVASAKKLSRNDVFLIFYLAILYLAKFPARNDMRLFSSKNPTIDLQVHMYESGPGCLVVPLASFILCVL